MITVSIRHALIRGAFHATIGIISVIALFLFSWPAVVLALAVVTALFLSLEVTRLFVPPFNQHFCAWFHVLLREKEHFKLTGSSYFLIGCLITALALPRDIASLAILFLAIGDPVATLVGTWKGRTYLWGKSLEGHIACFIACILIGVLMAVIVKSPPLTVALVGAVFATIFQALSLPVNDNITIPLGSALVMWALDMLI
jgi:dolichol kinase